MRTYEVLIGKGSRSQRVRVQADNIMKARMLFETQYGPGCTRGRNIKEIRESGNQGSSQGDGSGQSGNKKRLGCLAYIIIGFFLFNFILIVGTLLE